MPRLLLFAAVLALALFAPAQAPAAQKFKAFVAYDDGACSNRGLNVFVTARFAGGTTEEKAAELRKRFAPRGKATLTVDDREYTLSPKRSRDFGDEDGATWFFGAVKVDAETAEELLGSSAELSYKTEARQMRFTARIARAACD